MSAGSINTSLVKNAIAEYEKSGQTRATTSSVASGGPSFFDHLKQGVESVDEIQKIADKMAQNVAIGKSENLHETMLALTQAELSFNLLVQVRNKALEAYQEVMRMPV